MNATLPLDPHELAELLGQLLAIADDAVIVCDEQQRLRVFNEGAERLFGHRASQVLGQPLALLLPEAARAAHDRHLHAYAASGVAARRMAERSEIQGRRVDGALFDAEASIAQLALGGRRYFAAILRDVSTARAAARELERAKAEAEAAARSRSFFLANMSHEIRTPLNAVIGMTTLLLDTPMSDEQRDCAQTIRASGEALLAIVNDVLDYSKADAGKLDLEQQVFGLRECVESALDVVAQAAADKGLGLAYLVEDDTPEALVGDAARLRQILVNLLSNAVKFTHVGEVHVVLRSERLGPGQRRLHLAVHDTGIGIAEVHLPQLFQAYAQLDPSTTRKYGGTGLGLAICRRLAELMGGDVAAESEFGRGSVFHVRVRVAEADGHAAPAWLRREVPGLAGRRVLIVDASQTHRRVLNRWALHWGLQPVTVPSVPEAIDRISLGEPCELAVLDAGGPDGAGLVVAQALQQRLGTAAPAVVLLCPRATRAGLPTAGQLAALGVRAVLSKPLKAQALFDTLRQALDDRPPPAPRVEPAYCVYPRETFPAPLRPRVLIAEDHGVNQRVARQLLRRLGYEADVVGNGLEAIEAVQRGDYGAVLMDVQMPEMDGLQAARWIVRRRAEGGPPRLIAMTANALPGDREACLAAGMDAYVAKPIELATLAAALRQAGLPADPQDPNTAGEGARVVAGPLLRTVLADDGPPVLDAGRLAALQALQDAERPDLVGELIALFHADVPLRLRALRAAWAGGDPGALAAQAHRLLSITDNLGVQRMSALCAEIEQRARSGRLHRSETDSASLDHLLDALDLALHQAAPALNAWRPGPGDGLQPGGRA